MPVYSRSAKEELHLNEKTLLITWGCLLRCVDTLVRRAGGSSGGAAGADWLRPLLTDSLAEPVLDCVRRQNTESLQEAALPEDSPVWIVCCADSLSAAVDRRNTEHGEAVASDRLLPLAPVFTHMNGSHPNRALPLVPQDGLLRLPKAGKPGSVSPDVYTGLLERLKSGLNSLPIGAEWTDSLLCLLENCTGTVPSDPGSDGISDISLYDRAKIAAAVGACISVYLDDRGVTDYRGALLSHGEAFRREQAFLLYSADFSGIQRFIYTVSTTKALSALRSRSFFLELTMEHYIDELLAACGVSRANLLYSGGGHCYILLPNTHAVEEALRAWNLRFNDWLIGQFGASLYLADGWTPCSGNDLVNVPAEEAPYKAMFRRVSAAIARRKLSRYSSEQVLCLNRPQSQNGARECRVCGRSDRLKGDLCFWCQKFQELSQPILTKPVILVTREQPKDADENSAAFPLPAREGEVWFSFTEEADARAALRTERNVLRVYTKNVSLSGLPYSTRLYVGDYSASSSMEALAEGSKGIRRLGVCRMDVDNLGQAFVAGLEQTDAKSAAERQKYVTLSRTATFSRQMSLFFKCYINDLLRGTEAGGSEFCREAEDDGGALRVSIVYSGGDDVFLVGAWTDVIRAACRIRDTFRAFSCEALTISGGVGLFTDHYPIRLAAAQTGELEDASKRLPHKDGISLFAPEEGYTYQWDDFERMVLGEKLEELQRFFLEGSPEKRERGNSFLYRLLELLRSTGTCEAQQASQGARRTRPLQLARYAYLLARLEPKEDERKASYRKFSEKMYRWALEPEERRQLVTAIYLFVYQNRKEK